MSRRLARQIAFQTLFQIDLGKVDVEEALEHRLADCELESHDTDYVKRAVRGVYRQLLALDAQINAVARGWEVSRLAATDRNILRLAIFEIVFMDDIPVRVTINEAVELAKEFGDDKSPAFINGLLGTVVRDGGFE